MNPAASNSTMAGRRSFPRQPLRTDPGNTDHGKFENDVVHASPL